MLKEPQKASEKYRAYKTIWADKNRAKKRLLHIKKEFEAIRPHYKSISRSLKKVKQDEELEK